MTENWSCSECGTESVEIATICILEESTGNYKDFCFDCGMKAFKQRMTDLGEKGIVFGWHFTIPDLRSKQNVCINYLPELVEY